MKYLSCKIGDVTIGHGHRIAVQSMCDTDTLDIEASVAQCRSLAAAGCDIIRLTTQGMKQVEALPKLPNGKIDLTALKAMTCEG